MRAVARLMSISERLASRALEVMPGPHSNLPGYELLRPISIERGEGAHLWDADGNEYWTTCAASAPGRSITATGLCWDAIHPRSTGCRT